MLNFKVSWSSSKFSIFQKKYLFLENNRALSKFLYGILYYLISIIKYPLTVGSFWLTSCILLYFRVSFSCNSMPHSGCSALNGVNPNFKKFNNPNQLGCNYNTQLTGFSWLDSTIMPSILGPNVWHVQLIWL